jgi:hypothetical protein
MNPKMPACLILGLLTLGATGATPAGALPMTVLEQATDVTQVYHHGRPHRPRIRVYPVYPVYPPNYVPDYSYFYPPVRGFEDRNPVWRGNMRGCTVDLGYGRYESCDK